jgi:hypothetical protein
MAQMYVLLGRCVARVCGGWGDASAIPSDPRFGAPATNARRSVRQLSQESTGWDFANNDLPDRTLGKKVAKVTFKLSQDGECVTFLMRVSD